jgi:hypothetical protein
MSYSLAPFLNQTRYFRLRQGCIYGCAGYLGHPFLKSERCTSTISLASHLALTKRDSSQEDRDQASHCLMSMYAPL